MADVYRLSFKCSSCGHEFFATVVEKCPRCGTRLLQIAKTKVAPGEPPRLEATATVAPVEGAVSDRDRFLAIKVRQRKDAKALEGGGGPAPIGG